jgi:hypothetical protein
MLEESGESVTRKRGLRWVAGRLLLKILENKTVDRIGNIIDAFWH